MNLALIMDELAAAGRTVVNRVFAYPTSKVEPPALVVAWPELVEYDQTYQRGLDKYMIPVFLVLGESGTQQGKRDQAAEWLSGSVKRALDSGAYSDGASVTVKTGEVDFLTVTGVEYLCFKFMVEVQAAGYGTPADSGHPPFNTTTEVVAYLREQNPAWVTSFMPCNPTSDTRDDEFWSLGQLSTFETPGTPRNTPSKGFYYPNSDPTQDQYTTDDYMFWHEPARAYQGSGYLQLISRNPYDKRWSPQVWRTLDQNGNEFPREHRCNWRMRIREEHTYDNLVLPDDFGYVNDCQIFKTRPSESSHPLISLGAARRTDRAAMRWEFNLHERALFDLPRLVDIEIPHDNTAWMHCELAWCLSDDTDGYLQFWQDGVQILDYHGATISDYWEQYGISWNIYHHNSPQNPYRVDLDEVGTGLIPVYDKLILPNPSGGYS